eukprot:2698729-Ditylum_brightwellii.AAC.1
MAGGKVVGRISNSGVDRRGLGRWAHLCLNGEQNKKIWIIGAYRLGNNKTTGNKTTYQQQRHLLVQQGIKEQNPSEIWAEDMLTFINRLPKEDEVLLAIDANREIGDKKLGKFLTFTRSLDVIGSTHGTNSPPTYIRGKTTVDYILATPKL